MGVQAGDNGITGHGVHGDASSRKKFRSHRFASPQLRHAVQFFEINLHGDMVISCKCKRAVALLLPRNPSIGLDRALRLVYMRTPDFPGGGRSTPQEHGVFPRGGGATGEPDPPGRRDFERKHL